MKVFISYRREDSMGHSGRLYDSLQSHFGGDSVFMDLTGIDSGRNFVEVIQGAIRSSDVLLAIIGKDWLTCAAPSGARRLDEPTDFVRTEIAEALVCGTPVIPVLIDGIPMPSQAVLPDPLKQLAFHDAHNISDERWSYDVGRLITAIEKLSGKEPRPAPHRTWLAAGAAVVLVAMLGGAYLLWDRYAHPAGIQEANAAEVRGTELLTSGKYDEAIAAFDKALAINPLGEGYYNRGLAYFFKQDLDKAIADWNNAIKLNASDGRAYRQRGNAFSSKGDVNLAIADYSRAIELDQNDVKAHYNRGLVLQSRDEKDKAGADFRSVVTIGSDADLARDAQARLSELESPPAGATARPDNRPVIAAGRDGGVPHARVAGDWSADVKYDWGDKYTEKFTFMVDGNEVFGTATFLGVRRGIVNGSVTGNRLAFQIQTQEIAGDGNKPREVLHNYRGIVLGNTINFRMQSQGGGASNLPIEFTATRATEGRASGTRERQRP